MFTIWKRLEIGNGWKPLTIITKHSILDVAAALDPPMKVFADMS